MDIVYKKTETSDYIKLLELFNIAFGKELPADYFRWKYKNGASYVAVLKNELVGHYGGIFFNFIYGGKKYKIVQATDLMTHPKVRHLIGNKSVLLNLANIFFEDCLNRGISFAYGFPGERSRLFGEKFLNYKPLCKVKYFYFKLKGAGGLHPFEKFQFINFDIKKIISLNKKEGIVKDIEYLQWRYIENPKDNYYIAYNEDSMIILKIVEREALIMDFFYNKEKNANELLYGVEGSLKNLGIEYLKTFPLDFAEREYFEEREENYFLEFKPLKINPENFLSLSQFSPSDYDAL